MAASWAVIVFFLLLAQRGMTAAQESGAGVCPHYANTHVRAEEVKARAEEAKARAEEAKARAEEVRARFKARAELLKARAELVKAHALISVEEVKARVEGRRTLSFDFRTCAILLGVLLVAYPLRELYNKCCAALDAASRRVMDPVQAFIKDQARPIAGGLAAFWLVARDWPQRLIKGVVGGGVHCLVVAWQRRPQGA